MWLLPKQTIYFYNSTAIIAISAITDIKYFMRRSKPSPPEKNDHASSKPLFLRIPAGLHAALIIAAGAAQQECGKRVSVNNLATQVLAKEVGFDLQE